MGARSCPRVENIVPKTERRRRYNRERQARMRRWLQDTAKDRGCQWPDKCYRADLTYHHVDPSEKEFSPGHDMTNVGNARLKLEVEKCVVLCRGHHHMAEAYLMLEIDEPEWRI